jgi:hypothetical protein
MSKFGEVPSQLPAKAAPVAADIMESVLLKGDLARLTPEERVTYYNAVCKSIGLNPLTQPFAYMTLQGKMQLYARRDAADQLRRLRNISIEILRQGLADELYSVHVQATEATSGRKDEDLGVVPLPANVKGEFRANLILKAVTKAKRRVTLSICGLGFLDETEVESIPDATTTPAPATQSLAEEMGDEIPEHSELHADASVPTSAAAAVNAPLASAAAAPLSLEDMAREAAMRGRNHLVKFFNSRNSKEKQQLRKIEAELVELYPNENGE